MKKIIALLLLSAGLVSPLRAQVTPTSIFVLTNLPAYVAGGTTSNLFTAGTTPTNNVISLRQGQGMAAQFLCNGTNAATTLGVSINWAASLDGTNYATTPAWLQLTNLANGTNLNVFVTNWAGAALNNLLFIAPYSIQNANAATNGVTNISAAAGFGNIVPGNYP